MRKSILGLWLFVFALMGTLILFYFKSIYANSIKLSIAEHGVFNFSNSEFNTGDIHKLHGEVEFYYDTLLTPADFNQSPTPIPSGLIQIPGKWNNFMVDSETINGHGKGTYRFEVNVPEKGWYGFKIKEFKSAYKLWVNNECLGGAGSISSKKTNMVPSRLRKEYYFLSDSNKIEVIIQASNFHHYKGGATETIIFGLSKDIINYKIIQFAIEVFIFGVLFILFIYHLTLFAYRPKDKSTLYFSLLCLAMLLRLGYTGEHILLEIAPFVPWAIATRIEYISFFSVPIFTVLFAQILFPNEISLRLVKLISYSSIGFILIVLFTPSTTFSYTPPLFIYSIGTTSFYLLIMVFISVLRGRKYSLSIFIGYFIFFVLSINDLLHYNNSIDTAFLMPIGLFILTISQAYVLAKKTSSAYSKIEILSDKLSDHANKLEIIVEQRTKEIQTQKEEIENQKNKIQQKAEQLTTTNEQLISLSSFKKDMTNMMIHDLKNPLNNIIGFASLPNNFEKYKTHIHSSGWVMKNLIQNILDVEKYESTNVSLNLCQVQLYELVDKAYEMVSYMVFKNEIQFENTITKTQAATIDNELIIRVFTNILSNAVKYGGKDVLIKISSEIIQVGDKDYCKVNIYNSGEAIPSEKINSIFHKFVQLHNSNEDFDYSTGIGLTFCRLAIERHGGQIGAISGKESGVIFWFTLPI